MSAFTISLIVIYIIGYFVFLWVVVPLMVQDVIGVSLYPFAAHSWVQCGTALVNDRLDRVRHFTPILTI